MRACEHCGAPAGASAPGWCDGCRRGARLAASDLLGWLVPDAEQLPLPPLDADPLAWPGYSQRRAEVRAATGADESVVAAAGRLAGSEVAAVVVAWEFGFLGGSMSSGAGAVIAAAYDTARSRRLPIVVLPSTGGARMQEGMASLVQMAATTVAATRHADAGLLQVAVLRDPTTGGVLASLANHADVILAEPAATIGFAGPRVAEAMTGGPLPEGSHTARGARAAGLVDAIVPRPDLPWVLARLCDWPGTADEAGVSAAPQDLGPDRPAGAGATDPGPTAAPHHDPDASHAAAPGPSSDPGESGSAARIARPATLAAAGTRRPPRDAWTQVQRARAPDRARAPQFLEHLDVVTELHGDRAGAEDPSLRVALTRLPGGRPAVVVACDPTSSGGRPGPGAYRKAWRGLRLAARVGVPVVTLIDTPGADASASSEAGGIAHHIARTFRELLAAPVPVASLVIGEGGSGGALALAVGDRLLIQEHATFSVIAPEGAAAILYRDPGRAAEVAPLLKPTAADLAALGIADEVVPEIAGAEVVDAWAAVGRHLDELTAHDPDRLLSERAARWRDAGRTH